jgi:hypothetical protein
MERMMKRSRTMTRTSVNASFAAVLAIAVVGLPNYAFAADPPTSAHVLDTVEEIRVISASVACVKLEETGYMVKLDISNEYGRSALKLGTAALLSGKRVNVWFGAAALEGGCWDGENVRPHVVFYLLKD